MVFSEHYGHWTCEKNKFEITQSCPNSLVFHRLILFLSLYLLFYLSISLIRYPTLFFRRDSCFRMRFIHLYYHFVPTLSLWLFCTQPPNVPQFIMKNGALLIVHPGEISYRKIKQSAQKKYMKNNFKLEFTWWIWLLFWRGLHSLTFFEIKFCLKGSFSSRISMCLYTPTHLFVRWPIFFCGRVFQHGKSETQIELNKTLISIVVKKCECARAKHCSNYSKMGKHTNNRMA